MKPALERPLFGENAASLSEQRTRIPRQLGRLASSVKVAPLTRSLRRRSGQRHQGHRVSESAHRRRTQGQVRRPPELLVLPRW